MVIILHIEKAYYKLKRIWKKVPYEPVFLKDG